MPGARRVPLHKPAKKGSALHRKRLSRALKEYHSINTPVKSSGAGPTRFKLKVKRNRNRRGTMINRE